MDMTDLLNNMHNFDYLVNFASINADVECNIYTKDKDGKYLISNDQQAKIVGLNDSEEILGMRDLDLYPKHEAKYCRQNDLAVMNSNRFRVFNEPFTSHAGKHMHAVSIKAPYVARTRTKKVIGVSGISIIQTREFFLDKLDATGGLSKRQLECLYYMMRGRSARRIASILKIKNRTVEHHLDAAKDKLSCYTRDELFDKALTIPYIRNRLLGLSKTLE